ncbi:SufS family cysteine desulfurase [Gynurincola endophyticus]|uniref:SufS family cysteine desulfurase n=1 Tax=Gynurincola endophyticus TaxID=2479004 RepID=UPI000F8ED0A7|nr:cysteine desulfurase [Gynurincola endophyticus]
MSSVVVSNYAGSLDIAAIRAAFPILSTTVNGKPLVYLDNGATTQKPQRVIDTINEYYTRHNSNIHRGVHFLSQYATDAYEVTRKKIQRFINAKHDHEIIFTKGTTDGINLLAYSFGKSSIQPGDEILISAMEHHSNIVPWQIMCEDRGAVLRVIPMNEKGELIMEEFYKLLNSKTKMVAITYISNSLGTVNPVKEIIDAAHQKGAKVMLDAAQAIHHIAVDVQKLEVDFLVFSSHKMYGPTGVGILYGKEELLNAMPPYQGGGDMIKTVTFEKTTYNELPFKFEAGTPNIEAGICLGAAVDFIESIGIDHIAAYEEYLLNYATEQIKQIQGVRIIGEAAHKSGVLSFVIDGTHPYDVGVLLDKMGIAVRTGHHCTEPVMNFFKVPGTIRASFAIYNTKEEVDALIAGLKKAVMMLL